MIYLLSHVFGICWHLPVTNKTKDVGFIALAYGFKERAFARINLSSQAGIT